MTMTLQTAQAQAISLTQFQSPSNKSHIAHSNGNDIVRIYLNCIACNTPRFDSVEVMVRHGYGNKSPFWCAECGKRAMKLSIVCEENSRFPEWNAVGSLFNSKLFEKYPRL